jgi:hypothetical protein
LSFFIKNPIRTFESPAAGTNIANSIDEIKT